MSNTFTGLLRTLKSTSSARDSILLSSCESELTELMHQIDVMVENKRLEWGQQLKAVKIQYEQKEREVLKLKETVEHRNKEVGQLQQKIESDYEKHKNMISKYEDQLGKLKFELDNVKNSYKKLQRNSMKNSIDAEKIKDQLASEKERHSQELHQQRLIIEELETKIREIETLNEVQEAKLMGMEEKKRSLVEKSEVMQNQLLSYQGQLTRKKQLLDNLEQKHVIKIAELENEILRQKDEIEAQEDIIKSLKISLEDSKSNEENSWKERSEAKDEVSYLKQSIQMKDKRISALEKEMKTLERNREKRESSKSSQEKSLLEKSQEQERMIVEYKNECLRLKKELASKISQEAFNASSNYSSKDVIKLQGLLDQKKAGHDAEIEGMRKQVTSLMEELHRRDVALASMSERAARIEENTRDLTSRHDKKEAELQVANAQLEALRLENRHLRDSSIEDHLATTADLRLFETHISDVETANARTVAQLEDENTLLRHEIEDLKNERAQFSADNVSAREAETQFPLSTKDDFQDETNQRITSLQDRLDETVKHYEEKLKELRAQNQSFVKPAEKSGPDFLRDAKTVLEQEGNAVNDSSKVNDDFENDENDVTNFFDIIKDDSVASSNNNSRRQSITKEFMTAEDQREQELQALLQARIMDLEQKTTAAMQKYSL